MAAAAIVEVVIPATDIVTVIISFSDARRSSAARADAAGKAVPWVACRLVPGPRSQHGLVSEVLCCEGLIAWVYGGTFVFGLSLALLFGLHLALRLAGCPGERQVNFLRPLFVVIVAVVLIGAVIGT